jgi:steroid 5-alpha reductase family enzyme
VGWAAGVGLVAVFFSLTAAGWLPRRLLVAALLGTWSLRLAGYLLFNRILGRPEDGRYVTLRNKWGGSANRRFFWSFQIQAGLAWLFGLPALVVATGDTPFWKLWDLAGIAI